MYGTKITNLQKLSEAGLNVPKFQIVSFLDIIDDYSKFNEFFQICLRKKPSEASVELHGYLSEHLTGKIAIKLRNKKYAVRSAANIEDGDSDSFAGQFDTFLKVDADKVKAKVSDCFMSLCDENVLSYIKEKQLNPNNIKLDVIVQEMVNPEFAGVIFTSNPQGLLNETVITIGSGVGENVVAEKVNTTSYYYNRTDRVYYYVGKNNILSADQIEEFVETISEIESIFGEHLDIEFALMRGEIYILQVRKITTLNYDHPLVLDNSNIVESYPGISLPLTISFAKMIYSGVFKSECKRLLRNDKELKKHEHVFKEMVGSCNGRMYYKISNWYELINYLPFNKKVTQIWNDMMGVKIYSEQKTKVSHWVRARVARNFVYELKHINKNMLWLEQHFQKVETEYRASFSKELSIDESMQLFHQVARKLFPYWDYTLINDMYTFINVGALKKRLGNQANKLISSVSNLESMRPIQILVSLAYNKGEIPAEDYRSQFIDYIKKYGDRNVEELKLESKTFRTNPKLLVDKINEYRQDPENLEKLYKRLTSDSGRKKLPRNPMIRARIKRCEQGIRNRERSRIYRSRIFGIVRELMLHIGKILYETNQISAIKDVFYLQIDEIEQLSSKELNLKAIIAERKKQYEMFAELPTYSRLVFAEHEFDKNHDSINNYVQKQRKKKLQGTPCSNGKVTAEAVVIDSIENNYDTKNKIIVTRSTDPGWVFMLARSKGVISERGSLLSHTAIISRELGIPSIVGVKDATNIIKTGDKLSMDGEIGAVLIEDKS